MPCTKRLKNFSDTNRSLSLRFFELGTIWFESRLLPRKHLLVIYGNFFIVEIKNAKRIR